MDRFPRLWLALALAAASSPGCALMQRSSSSGYGGSSFDDRSGGALDRDSERAQLEREGAASELGVAGGADLTSAQRRAVERRIELKRLERTELESRRDREQYYKAKALLKNDADRVEFLKVGSFEGRERWLRAQGIDPNSPKFAPDVQDLIQSNDVALGMSKQAVRESWGEPEAIEVAGNPVFGNERWRFIEQIASSEGYQTEGRMIYFEGGRVVGWERF